MAPDEAPAPPLGSTEALLVETFDIPLLAFMCGTDAKQMRARVEARATLSEAAETVMRQQLVPLAQVIAARMASQPTLPRSFSMDFLGQRVGDQSFSLGVALREAAGVPVPGELLARCEEDPVKSCLTRMAVDSFPLLLAPRDSFWPRASLSHYSHPMRSELQALVQADGALSLLYTKDDPGLGRRGTFLTSLGRGGSHQDVMFSEMIIGSAWDTLAMTKELPGLSELVDQVHINVDVMRTAAKGGWGVVPARVVFTGFTMRAEDEILTPWGLLRPLRDWERRLAPPALEGAVAGTSATDGRQVTVSYAGEVILETQVPYAIAVRDDLGEAYTEWPFELDGLQRRLEGIQLAALLSSDGLPETWTTAKLAWTWVGDPYGHGSTMGWSDVRSGPGFMPVELTPEQCTELGEWTKLVHDGWRVGIDIAVRRLLSAANARTDMADRLVDSVIVWENLFGTSQGEPTLRISAAIAWLLGEGASGREELQGVLKKLYAYRSRIVHGGQPDQKSLGDNANLALKYARDSLRVLLKDRSDVLILPDGAARSVRLISGG